MKKYKTRYPNGYTEKIGYYTYKVNKAIEELNPSDLVFYTAKLEYFMNRQLELNERLAELVD
tara:strand:+ start:279 stop:464 length:186 start_codon:yes stop_codon:yes gene_type:complete